MKIIVCGLPRSGTTILSSFINSIPDSFIFGEPHWEYKKTGKTTFFLPELSSLSLKYKDKDLLPLDDALTTMEETFKVVGFKETYRPEPLRIQDKDAPNNKLLDNYKKSGYKFIYIARNPIELLCSARNIFGGDNTYWPRNIDIMIDSYVNFFNFTEGEQIINYDKFVLNPEIEFSRVTNLTIPLKIELRKDRIFALGDPRGYSSKEISKKECKYLLSEKEANIIGSSVAMKLWENIK
jgi:hypothetical protein